MNRQYFSEEQFFLAHERIKAEGCRIIRCVQRDGGKARIYELIWVKP